MFIIVLIVTIASIYGFYKVEPSGESVSISCMLEENMYTYKFDLDVKTKEILQFETNDLDLKSTFVYNKNEDVENILTRIEKLIQNKGGTCGF